jgi:hypothetical protein
VGFWSCQELHELRPPEATRMQELWDTAHGTCELHSSSGGVMSDMSYIVHGNEATVRDMNYIARSTDVLVDTS